MRVMTHLAGASLPRQLIRKAVDISQAAGGVMFNGMLLHHPEKMVLMTQQAIIASLALAGPSIMLEMRSVGQLQPLKLLQKLP